MHPTGVAQEWTRLFLAYLNGPGDFWPAGAEDPKAKKLQIRLARLLTSTGRDRAQLLRRITAFTEVRLERRRPTVYLSNAGGSGSHWLEAMLAEGGGFLACGEVYLPDAVIERLAEFPLNEQAAFIDAIHIVHSRRLSDEIATWNAINTSHRRTLDEFLNPEPKAVKVLLIRDPLDIVLSRTFRKQKWRREVAPAVNDVAYLRRNIVDVTRFYEAASRRDVDLTLRYEDLRVDPRDGLRRLSALAGVCRTEAEIDSAAERHSSERILTGEVDTTGNLFRGPRDDVPAGIREEVEAAVADVRERFGY